MIEKLVVNDVSQLVITDEEDTGAVVGMVSHRHPRVPGHCAQAVSLCPHSGAITEDISGEAEAAEGGQHR